MRLPICDSAFVAVSLLLHVISVAAGFTSVWLLLVVGHPVLAVLVLCVQLIGVTVTNFASMRWTNANCELASQSSASTTGSSHTTTMDVDPEAAPVGCVCTGVQLVVALVHRHMHLLLGQHAAVDSIKRKLCEMIALRAITVAVSSAPSLIALWLIAVPAHEQLRLSDASSPDVRIFRVLVGVVLCDVCYSLASLDGHSLRHRSGNRLLLSWPIVLSRFAWRSGCLISRLCCLVLHLRTHGLFQLLLLILLHFAVVFAAGALFQQAVHQIAKDNRQYKKNTANDLVSDRQTASTSWTAQTLISLAHCFVYLEVAIDRVYRLLHLCSFYFLLAAENALVTVLVRYRRTEDDDTSTLLLIVWLTYAVGLFFLIVYHQVCAMGDDPGQGTPCTSVQDVVHAPPGTYFYRTVDTSNRVLRTDAPVNCPGNGAVFQCQLPAFFTNQRPAKKRSNFVMPGVGAVAVYATPHSEPTRRKQRQSGHIDLAQLEHSISGEFFDSRPPETITTLPKNLKIELMSPAAAPVSSRVLINAAYTTSSSDTVDAPRTHIRENLMETVF